MTVSARQNFMPALAGLMLALWVSGCGGGSSAGDEPVSPTGLLPAAPVLGEILAMEAQTLYPMGDGYRAQFWRGPGTDAATYVLNANATAGSFTELRTDAAASNRRTLTLADGGIRAVDADGIANVPGQALSYHELRSPVRAGDQQTVFDQAGVALDTDVDADGTKDKADIAVYRRVIGWESIELPVLSRTVVAARVDTISRVRAYGSKTGSALPVRQVRESTWYLPFVGPVRRLTTEPAESADGPVKQDLSLRGRESGAGGLGYLGPFGPGSTAWPTWPRASVSLGDRVLVIGGNSPLSDGWSTKLSLSAVSARGELLVTQPLELQSAGTQINHVRLVRVDAQTAALVWSQTRTVDSSRQTRIRMMRINRSGAPLDPYPGIELPIEPLTEWDKDQVPSPESSPSIAKPIKFDAAYDGQRLWVVWRQPEPLPNPVTLPFRLPGGQLVVQAFDLQGRPASAASILETEQFYYWQLPPYLTVRQGKLLVTWGQMKVTYIVQLWSARHDGNGGFVKGATGVAVWGDSLNFDGYGLTPMLTASGTGLVTWSEPWVAVGSGPQDRRPRGWTLGTGVQPPEGPTATVETSLLPLAPLSAPGLSRQALLGDTLAVAQTDFATLSPKPASPTLRLSYTPLTGKSLAEETFANLSIRQAHLDAGAQTGLLDDMLALDDRLLLIGHTETGAMTFTVAWPR